ncbi:MAG: DUF983 domain-containing protein [Rhodobiaceae bacterium]|nr:DUF983 domain-containing protein [Rhodobiaceae bacterium]
MSEQHHYPPLRPTETGMRGRCPRCGQGRLFSGFLTTAKSCSSCGLDYAFIDSGDGPAVFVIFIVGFIGMVGVFVTEFVIGAPMWLNLGIWIPLIIIMSLGLLRPLKGWMIAQQYARRAAEGRLHDE